MIKTNSENKKVSEQTGHEPVQRLFFTLSERRRSFLNDVVCSDASGFFRFGLDHPALKSVAFLDICDNILEKNKTQITPFFESKTDPCITAIVPSNFSGDKNSFFDQCGHVFGSAKTASTETCGKVRAKVICSEEYNHDYYYKHERCNNPDCPTCYSKFAHKLADRVVGRVLGYMTVYPEDAVDHVVLWPHVLTGYRTMTEAFCDARRMLVKMGSTSAVVWYHPYRIRGEIKKKLRRYRNDHDLPVSVGFWEMVHDDVLDLSNGIEPYVEYGPHFHVLSTGYLMNSQEYSSLGCGGYKKVRRISSVYDLERVAYYLSTHACWETGHQAVRYYGKISTSKLAKGYPRETIVDVVCKVCGKPMVEHYCDDADVLSGVAHDHVTKRVISYMYWKRGMKPKVPVYQEFQVALPIGVDAGSRLDVSDASRCPLCGLVMHKIERYERGYKYRYTCSNTNCVDTAVDEGVWYDSSNIVTTPPH